jgi:hypothetical protein
MPVWEILYDKHGKLYICNAQGSTSRAVGTCQITCYAGVAEKAKRSKTASSPYVNDTMF